MKQSILLILVIFKFKEKVYTGMENKGQSNTIFYLKHQQKSRLGALPRKHLVKLGAWNRFLGYL